MNTQDPPRQPYRKVTNITPIHTIPTRTQGNLPHWHIGGVIQFVTFRLAGSLPQEKLNAYQAEKEDFLKQHPQPWAEEIEQEYYNKICARYDDWLDAGYGNCLLQNKDIRDIIENCLWHNNNKQYILHTYVIMPNHVHVLFEPVDGNSTTEILRAWKGVTAHHINSKMNKAGALWQRESFDRVIRSEEHYKQAWEYIQHNPIHIPKGEYTLCGE